MFTIAERLQAAIANKLIDKIEALQEKEEKDLKDRMRQLLESDVNEHFTNTQLKYYLDPRSAQCLLEDLSHAFIHRAVVVGSRKLSESYNKDNTKSET